jgi:DNA-nicking Smr family endonuclease
VNVDAMAKLEDLRKLVDAARSDAAETSPRAAPRARPIKAHQPHARPANRTPTPSRSPAAFDLAQAFADVQPLRASKRAANPSPRPAPIARQRIADEADALTASKYGAEPAPTAWDIGQEHEAEQTFLRRGLPSDILRKLRRGHWAVQGEIDLHGHTIDEAHDALSDFIVEARQRGHRCVRAIHGKGLTSPNREPVLKGRVRKWLAHWDEVLAYCEAPPNAGGGGAVMILLRGR